MSNNLHQAQSHDILRSWQSQRNDINHHKDFVLPMFIGNNDDAIESIESMPDVYRYGCNTAIDYLDPLVNKYGLRAVLLFPVVTKTDRVELDNEGVEMSDSEHDDSSEGRSNSSSSQSTLENSSDEDEDDVQEVSAERLLGEDEQTNNPFYTFGNHNQSKEEEDHLLAGEQGSGNVLATDSVKATGAAPPKPPPRANEKALMKISQVQDIKLIKGMALKDKYNPVLRLIPKIRAKFPKLLIICDVCLCAFTSTGHCCLFEDHSRAKSGKGSTSGSNMMRHFPISNKTTCQYLAMLAVEYARRGCDVIAPSDMMDGRILTIREMLNESGLHQVSIMSYSAKFASAFYGPFRQATDNAPEFGDRRAYQLPPGSRALASKAVQRDIDQGADFVMVKPGGLYLDIVRDISEKHPDVPIAIYQVSGEYSMLKLAAKAGLIDLKLALNETLTAFRRAGVSIIISYFTPEILRGELLPSDM